MEGLARKGPVSRIDGDIWVLAASYGATVYELTHFHTVRGVPVETTRQVRYDNGRVYRLCIFTHTRLQWVNENNLKRRRIAATSELKDIFGEQQTTGEEKPGGDGRGISVAGESAVLRKSHAGSYDHRGSHASSRHLSA